jgi:hypothetical protein
MRAEFGKDGPEEGTARDVKGKWITYGKASGEKSIALKHKADSGKFLDEGAIEMPDDYQRCIRWNKIDKGKTRCFTTWRKGDIYQEVNTGSGRVESYQYTIVKGNPDGL